MAIARMLRLPRADRALDHECCRWQPPTSSPDHTRLPDTTPSTMPLPGRLSTYPRPPPLPPTCPRCHVSDPPQQRLLAGPIGRGEAAGAPVLVHRAAPHHGASRGDAPLLVLLLLATPALPRALMERPIVVCLRAIFCVNADWILKHGHPPFSTGVVQPFPLQIRV